MLQHLFVVGDVDVDHAWERNIMAIQDQDHRESPSAAAQTKPVGDGAVGGNAMNLRSASLDPGISNRLK